MIGSKQVQLAALAGALVSLGLAPLVAAADDARAHRTISVTGQGEASGAPDMATVTAGVHTRAPTVIAASEQNQAVVERIFAALEAEDVARKDIRTVDYSIWPQERHDPSGAGNSVITGYQVQNSVQVTVRKLDRLGELLAAVTDAGANTIHGISFGVEDNASLEAKARRSAMEDAHERAEALAELAGVELGAVLHISMSAGGGYPGPMPMARREAMSSAPEPGIMAGEHTVAVEVQVTYRIPDKLPERPPGR
jgi:uncharacterized protein